jgi:hypothetical protein
MRWILKAPARELPKHIPELIFSAIGFFIALFINGLVKEHREQATFQSMLVSLRAEASSNETVVTQSYQKFFPEGVVLREFRTQTAQALLASPVFMKYLKSAQIEVINQYVNDLALANGYRRAIETLSFEPTPSHIGWLSSIKEYLGEELKEAEREIKVIQSFGA